MLKVCQGMKYCISFSRTSAVPQPKRRQQRTNLYATRNHVRQPYATLRMQVERQQPVYFLDALGRVTPFHLEFIRSAEVNAFHIFHLTSTKSLS